MCGIAGQFNFQRREPVERETIVRMADSIAHRGPDDEGYFFAGPVGLGFRRLSIIDLAGGHQPMSDADETVWVIFNGEIYNFRSCARNSKNLGHRFRTIPTPRSSFTATRNGAPDVLQPSQWHVRSRNLGRHGPRLVVARDAMGIKLVYYRIANGQLKFRLRDSRRSRRPQDSRPEVDPVALEPVSEVPLHAVAVNDFSWHPQACAAGTMLVVEDGKCREERWYHYTPFHFRDRKTDKEAAEELLRTVPRGGQASSAAATCRLAFF